MELELELKPQKHRAIVSRGILDAIEYEVAMGNKADDILDIVIDIRDTAERIIKLMALQKCDDCIYVRGSQWCEKCDGEPKHWVKGVEWRK